MQRDMNRGGRWGWLDRLLLALVLVLQVVILLRGGGRASSSDGAPQAALAAESPTAAVMPAPPVARPTTVLRAPRADGFDQMVDRMNSMMAGAMRDWDTMSRMMSRTDRWPHLDPIPTLDMREDEGAYTVVFSLPGVALDGIRVILDNRLLTVSIPRTVPGGGRHRQVIRLPGPVGDAGAATATLTNGVLRVSVPKGRLQAGGQPVGLRLF